MGETREVLRMDIEQARFNMIEQQIRPAGVLDDAVLGVLGRMRREAFVPAARRALAFAQLQVPLAHGQAMFEPVVEAQILQALQLRRSDKVLEIGTGSGFMAALMGALAGHVVSLEIDPELALEARENLFGAGVDNVHVEQADGALGFPAQAPYDVILASGAVPDVPQCWLSQLAPGGRLLVFVQEGAFMQARLLRKQASGDVHSEDVFATRVPCLNLGGGHCFRF